LSPVTSQQDLTSLGDFELTDLEEEQGFLKLLIFGESGVGKTVLASTAALVPSMSPMLFLNIEGGLLSAQKQAPRLKLPKGSIKSLRLNKFLDIEPIYNTLADSEHSFRTVVIDSLTELQKCSMEQIMRDVARKDATRDLDIPAQRDWGKTIEQIRRVVRGFRDLDMHVIMTCLAKEDKDELTGEVKVRPDLPGKLAGQVPAFFDEVFYMYNAVKEDPKNENANIVTRHLLTANAGKYIGKDRSGNLPLMLENPTLEDVVGYIFQE